MTQVLIEKATLEQLVGALETGRWNTRAIAGWAPAEIDKDYKDDHDKINAAIAAGRAALAGAEPTGWQPIETAPMDGTRVLIKGDGSTQVAGYGRVTGCDFDSWVIANDVHIPNPKHWMKKP